MSQPRVCPECGEELSESSTEGLCTKCLLKAGLGQSTAVSNFDSEAPTIAPASATSSDDPTLANETRQNAPSSAGTNVGCFGDYELLEEIARGGMGIVYRARHRRLNRTVALKTILRGEFASEDEVRRFYQEAEAAARLDHSGIVPIYEIGEHEGHHFFSMKLIEGSSLAQQMPEQRRDLRGSIELLAKVARSVHHAHQRGILHRDIKPENILIEEASGEPLLTDLGLARQVEQDKNLTKSGVVVGTPAYMPPEQASGEELTTAADIYSLGAILYEVLTGRPPFCEATPVATLMKLLNESPTPPCEVENRVDRGLEAVCLKCLARDPNQRYSSAAAFADDLQNWLDGKSLSVRPPTLGSVVQSWFVHNLRSVTGALLVGGAFGTLTTVFVFYLVMAPEMNQYAQLYDAFPDVRRPLLARTVPFAMILNQTGEWAEWIAALIFLPLGICVGLFNALVVRPSSRPAAIAAGMVASLAAVLIGLVGIFGWLSTLGISIHPTQQDIRWLAYMALDERQGTREEARRQLHFKYPDLRAVPAQQRAGHMAWLINGQQVTKLPWAMIAGLLSTVGTFAVPILVGTVVATRLLSDKKGFWHVAFGYLEPLGVLALLGMMLGLTVLGPLAGSGSYMLPPLYIGWLLVTFSVATWAAVAGWSAIGRILAHTAWIAAVVLLGIELKDINRSREVANRLVYQGRFDAAADRLERYIRWKSWELGEGVMLCTILAQSEDSDDFREQSRRLAKECGTRNSVDAHHWAARISLLGDPSPRDVSMAVELAESATRPVVEDPKHWYRFSLAVARYHEGKPEESLQFAEHCLQSSDSYCVACARVVRVASLQRLNKPERASEELTELDKFISEHTADFQLAPGVDWVQVLYYEALRKSIESNSHN